MERAVVNRLVEVLDEDVSDTGLAEAGVTLRPHDADGVALAADERKEKRRKEKIQQAVVSHLFCATLTSE